MSSIGELPKLTAQEVADYFSYLHSTQATQAIQATCHGTRSQATVSEILPNGQGICLFCNKMVYVSRDGIPAANHKC